MHMLWQAQPKLPPQNVSERADKGSAQIKGASRKHFARVWLAGIGDSARIEYTLHKRKTTIGSASDNDLVITQPTISRHHAVIRRRFGRFRLIDLASTNGSFVNTERIRVPRLIGKGDEIRFGAARFVFLDRAVATARRRVSVPAAIGLLLVLFASGFGLIQRIINRSLSGELARTKQTEREAETGLTNQLEITKADLAKEAALANQPEWLWRVNYWRRLAHLPTVTEDAELLPGLTAHARYLVLNRNVLQVGAAMHNEDPKLPGFTPEGLAAATKYASVMSRK
jgi:pSer/pThr/pTyr-binding forkhead associated (FHA) protein